MSEFRIILQICKELLAVCKLLPAKGLPGWVQFGSDEFLSVTQTSEELSIVCSQDMVPQDVKAERGWHLIRIKGQLDFSLVGILKRVISPLSDNGISIYTISTYDTDYVLIKDEQFDRAITLLSEHFSIES
jgi:hypothetical protein